MKKKVRNNKIKKLMEKIKKAKINKKIIAKNILSWTLEISAIVIAIISLNIDIKVKEDTAELTKFSEKPIYYKIRLYPTKEMYEYTENEKYIWLNLELVVDDFEIEKEDLKNVNYNATFTHKKYFMVYDYDLGETKNKYYYFRTRIDEKGEAELRLDNRFHASMTGANYSKTPNNKYIYMLIYTETLSEQNLDLIFFEYIENENGLTLKYETNENGDIEIDTELIDKDVNICKEYFIETWANGDEAKTEDLKFLFDVYNDLGRQTLT